MVAASMYTNGIDTTSARRDRAGVNERMIGIENWSAEDSLEQMALQVDDGVCQTDTMTKIREEAEGDMTNLATSIRELPNTLEMFLTGREFRFGRIGGLSFSRKLLLDQGGKIRGYTHPNEHSWSVEAGNLAFHHEDGSITTTFDRVDRGANSISLLGRLRNGEYGHELVENLWDRKTLAPFVRREACGSAVQNRVAVLIRSHHCDEKFQNLLAKLLKSRRTYDVYALIDETHGRPIIDYPNVIWHSVAQCREIGLSQEIGLWWCGDFPLYFALRELPSYSHYLMLEYDVELLEDDCGFIDEVSQAVSHGQHQSLDFAGISFRPDPSGAGGWAGAWQQTFPRETSHYATFPMVLVSKRLAAFAFAQRQLEALRCTPVVHCEAFLPSCAFAGGFECIDFLDLIPGSYDASLTMNLRGRKLGLPLGASYPMKPGIRAIHPVYSHKEFLDRLYTKHARDGWKIESLEAALQSAEIKILPRGLIDSFLERLPTAVYEALGPTVLAQLPHTT